MRCSDRVRAGEACGALRTPPLATPRSKCHARLRSPSSSLLPLGHVLHGATCLLRPWRRPPVRHSATNTARQPMRPPRRCQPAPPREAPELAAPLHSQQSPLLLRHPAERRRSHTPHTPGDAPPQLTLHGPNHKHCASCCSRRHQHRPPRCQPSTQCSHDLAGKGSCPVKPAAQPAAPNT